MNRTFVGVLVSVAVAAVFSSFSGPSAAQSAASSTGPAEGSTRWYSILRERTDAFCDYYFEQQAKSKGTPVAKSSSNRFQIPGQMYVYTDAEVQALLKYCPSHLDHARKQWEADHPGQKAPF